MVGDRLSMGSPPHPDGSSMSHRFTWVSGRSMVSLPWYTRWYTTSRRTGSLMFYTAGSVLTNTTRNLRVMP
jgi:hypothetical protein